MNKRKCENCEYCVRQYKEIKETKSLSTTPMFESIYYCHGHAPKMVNDWARWPQVKPDDWCGMFKNSLSSNVIITENPMQNLQERTDIKKEVATQISNDIVNSNKNTLRYNNMYSVIMQTLGKWSKKIYIIN